MGLKIISGDLPRWGTAAAGKRGAIVPKKRRLSLSNLWSYNESVPIESINQLSQNQGKGKSVYPGGGLTLGLGLNYLMGPTGFAVGLLAGSATKARGEQVTFACRLRDGRQFVAVCDPATYQQFLATAVKCGATINGMSVNGTAMSGVSGQVIPQVGRRKKPIKPPASLPPSPLPHTRIPEQIFIARPEKTHGPYRLDEVNRFLAAGQLSPSDLAWFEGCAGWLPLAQIQGVQLPQSTLPPPTSC